MINTRAPDGANKEWRLKRVLKAFCLHFFWVPESGVKASELAKQAWIEWSNCLPLSLWLKSSISLQWMFQIKCNSIQSKDSGHFVSSAISWRGISSLNEQLLHLGFPRGKDNIARNWQLSDFISHPWRCFLVSIIMIIIIVIKRRCVWLPRLIIRGLARAQQGSCRPATATATVTATVLLQFLLQQLLEVHHVAVLCVSVNKMLTFSV